MNFDEFCYESKVEEEYSRLHDEFGDRMPTLSEFKEQRYREYLDKIKNGIREYISNTDPKIGDKVKLSRDENGEVWTVDSVMGGRLGNKVGITNGQESREYYYYCLRVIGR